MTVNSASSSRAWRFGDSNPRAIHPILGGIRAVQLPVLVDASLLSGRVASLGRDAGGGVAADCRRSAPDGVVPQDRLAGLMRSARFKDSTQTSWPRWKRGDILAAALAVLITIYGGLLRFEALQGNYSQLKQPQWVRTLADYTLPLARALRPDTIAWGPHPSPFVGGDPQNYLRFAREMTSFYQAHVREPIFLALTRTYLWVTNDSDIAVAFASATGGTLAILATFLLGAAAVSRCVGLAAAAALAIEYRSHQVVDLGLAR